MILTNRVLLIDDEQNFAETLAERLELQGMVVETAASGEEALDKVKQHDYDAVLLDYLMPGWDGIETLKHLKAIKPDLQIVLLTGHATVQKGVAAIKAGALDIVEKPADFSELIQKIEEASAQKAILVEEKIEHDLEDIIRKRGW